jgi:succinoglycan biosynthesis protein ExoA
MTAGRPRVSVLLPIRNEERYIARCLDSLAAQDYPPERCEVLVMDGRSTDRTREIVERYRDRLPGLRLLDSPHRSVPFGMNLGIEAARGEVIVRVDGHCVLAPDYVRRCVEVLEETRAQCVGGPMRCRGEGYWGEAIAAAMNAPFGVGSVLFRREDYRGTADTVYLGAWPRELFAHIGMFDEEMTNNQDDELAYRLGKAGGLILLDPTIRSTYFARTSVTRLARQYYRYGLYKVRVFQKHPFRMKLRHFVPPTFVVAAIALAAAAPFDPRAAWFGGALAALYVAANVVAAAALARATRVAFLPAYPLLFAILHFSYGAGFLAGLGRFGSRWLVPEEEPPRLPTRGVPLAGEPPRVSVVVPMRNEAPHLDEFFDSLRRQDYPRDRLEFLLVDGESEDGTRQRAEREQTDFAPGNLRVLRNPRRSTPEGLNLALREATGSVIVRMDVHAVYAPDYVRQCVTHLLSTGAAQVGGPQVAEGKGLIAEAVAAALNSPFGVGGATFRYLRRRSEVESVYLGCAWTEALRGLGGWNVDALYDEDTDLHARMRRQGGVLLLLPEIRVRYRPRSTWFGLALQYFRYGLGRARTFRRYPETMRVSHLVPPAFLGLAAGCAVLAWVAWPAAWWGFVALLIALTFPWMHLSWTAGLLAGVLRHGLPWRAVQQALSRLRRSPATPVAPREAAGLPSVGAGPGRP